jgi:hypothetical protein
VKKIVGFLLNLENVPLLLQWLLQDSALRMLQQKLELNVFSPD